MFAEMLKLDLIELADLVHPEKLVDAIIKQNPSISIPIPVEEIARLAGISKIQPLSSAGFEGTLIANAEKSDGEIFFNSTRPRSRQRFTIGHELGHFLLPWHRHTTFNCTTEDISGRTNKDWEAQANQFAAELLLPRSLVTQRLKGYGSPEMSNIQKLAQDFETSIEATARRFIELSEYPCAVVFSKDNIVRYSVKTELFAEQLDVWKGDRLPNPSMSRQATSDPDEWHEIEAYWWLKERKGCEVPESVYEQTLCQEIGYKVTLLTYE